MASPPHLFLASLAFVLLPTRALEAMELFRDAEFRLDASIEWALETRSGQTQKLDWVLEPSFQVEFPGQIRLTALGRFRVDLIDSLEPGQPSQLSVARSTRRLLIGDPGELELRELYLDIPVRDWLLRIGKQQVVWGQADGLKVLDVVNPQTFREFVLDAFEDSRTPLWMANLEGPFVAGSDLQLLWIPDPTYHEFPEPGARFAFSLPKPPPGVALVVDEPDPPPRWHGKNSDVGARLSAFWRGWDLALYYLYRYDDFPVLARTIEVGPMGPQVRITPRYERTHLAGASTSSAFGDFTFRSEMGYTTRRFFSVDDLDDLDGVAPSGELSYVIGLDWSGLSETLLSGQVFQSWVTNGVPGLRRDRLETTLSFLLRREFLNDTLVFSLLWLHGINRGDGLARLRLDYEFSDSLLGRLGFDGFYGDSRGLFGQFDQRDRLVMGFEWSWASN